jgi:hypothetical protein
MLIINIIGTAIIFLLVLFISVHILRSKSGLFFKIACNSLLGVTALLALQLFDFIKLPFNLFNVLITGFLGAPGLVAIYVINLLLF